MCFRVFVFWFFNKVRQFEDEETRLTDIKTPFLGPGVAAASERAAILDRNPEAVAGSVIPYLIAGKVGLSPFKFDCTVLNGFALSEHNSDSCLKEHCFSK